MKYTCKRTPHVYAITWVEVTNITPPIQNTLNKAKTNTKSNMTHPQTRQKHRYQPCSPKASKQKL
jgi:hypothetical protein